LRILADRREYEGNSKHDDKKTREPKHWLVEIIVMSALVKVCHGVPPFEKTEPERERFWRRSVPPGLPDNHLALLRKAVSATIADPEFAAALEQKNMPFRPLSGRFNSQTWTRPPARREYS
jgi:hypothetical protein